METVAEIIGDETEDVVAKPVEPPRHPHQEPLPPPGIYFGMPDDVYHSIHACSASGLKKLSVSSMDYWATSLLNLDRLDDPSSKDSGQLTPMELGKAYHTYICEGVAVFAERYAVALDKDACRLNAEGEKRPLCVTIADLRGEIDRLGVKPKGTSKDALADQLLDIDPAAHIWDRMMAAHNEAHKGKTMISTKLFRRIAIAKAMIDNDPKLKDAFAGGHAEVSIFWLDEATGVPMKARIDYLKMNSWVDLKSFGNMAGKPIQRAIDAAIANNKYYMPVVIYDEAIEAAKKMVRETKAKCINIGTGYDGWTEGKYEALEKWAWDWAHQPPGDVLFVFQQTGLAPVTRGRIMPRGNHYTITVGAAQYLKRKWKRCAETYGVDPWVDFEPVMTTADEEVGFWASDFGSYD